METSPQVTADDVTADKIESAYDHDVGAFPNLVVIGAQKCGTSGLHYYLSLHPEIAMSETKELNFFIKERGWTEGLDWYRAQFDPASAFRGEASPNYTAHPQHRGVARRMHEVIPDAKLIYIVRDPLARIAAHWVHNHAKGRDQGDLRRTITHPKTSYLPRSKYHMQMQRFLRFYPLEQIHVIEQDDLRLRRDETLRELFAFIGVDPDFTDRRFQAERHKTGRKTRPTKLGAWVKRRRSAARFDPLPAGAWALAESYWPLGRRIERPDVRAVLGEEIVAELREDAVKFRELTGRDFAHWSIWEK